MQSQNPLYYLGIDARKPVFGIPDQVRLKPVYSPTETSWNIQILLVASLDMILSNKQITKVLIRLCRLICAFVVGKPLRQIFSRRGPIEIMKMNQRSECAILIDSAGYGLMDKCAELVSPFVVPIY